MCYNNILITLAADSAIIKYKNILKMQRQLTSVSQETIKVISFYKVYKECYEIF